MFPGVPTMFSYLTERLDALDAPGLRMCISAGAILPAAVNERFETVFGVPLLDGYGITETSTFVTMNWPTGTRVMGSCGLPFPGLTVRLVDPATGADVAPGDEGEIWVQGPNVTPGYHRLPDATAAAIVDGWYRTGDLARRDEHGYLRISGRTKELIIRGGENVYPAEVEDALLADGVVADAAVVGRAARAPRRGAGGVRRRPRRGTRRPRRGAGRRAAAPVRVQGPGPAGRGRRDPAHRLREDPALPSAGAVQSANER